MYYIFQILDRPFQTPNIPVSMLKVYTNNLVTPGLGKNGYAQHPLQT